MRRVVFGILAALAVAAPAQAAPSLVSATADGVPVAVARRRASRRRDGVVPGAAGHRSERRRGVRDRDRHRRRGRRARRASRAGASASRSAARGSRSACGRSRRRGTRRSAACTVVAAPAATRPPRATEDLSGRAEGVLSDLRRRCRPAAPRPRRALGGVERPVPRAGGLRHRRRGRSPSASATRTCGSTARRPPARTRRSCRTPRCPSTWASRRRRGRLGQHRRDAHRGHAGRRSSARPTITRVAGGVELRIAGIALLDRHLPRLRRVAGAADARSGRSASAARPRRACD